MTKTEWQPELNGKLIGFKDVDNEEICAGDVVRFYFDADRGVFRGEHRTKACKDYTEMIDVAGFVNDRAVFMCDNGRSSYPFRYNKYCKIIWHYPRQPIGEKEND